MNGYKLTIKQKDLIAGQQYRDDCKFNPVPDINGDYFIFAEEVEHCDKPEFAFVKGLQASEFIPPVGGNEL